MFEVGDKVVSILTDCEGTIVERYEMGWYMIRWIDGRVTKGQHELYRRITEEDFVARCMMRPASG